ncbi:hypothetical protein ACP70R_043394 [Stipagrostis hirtigluma subsp. patula]
MDSNVSELAKLAAAAARAEREAQEADEAADGSERQAQDETGNAAAVVAAGHATSAVPPPPPSPPPSPPGAVLALEAFFPMFPPAPLDISERMNRRGHGKAPAVHRAPALFAPQRPAFSRRAPVPEPDEPMYTWPASSAISSTDAAPSSRPAVRRRGLPRPPADPGVGEPEAVIGDNFTEDAGPSSSDAGRGGAGAL